MPKQKKQNSKQKKGLHMDAQLLYVITIAWYVSAVGCFMQGVGLLGAIAAAVATIHLVWAIVQDRKEGKQESKK